MSALELEAETFDLGVDIPEIIHLADEEETRTLCGAPVSEVYDEEDAPEPDCVVCIAEAERLGLYW